MKQFEEGKTYKVNGPGSITVTKKTAHFITYTGDHTGRKKIYALNLFGLGENILIPSECKSYCYFCYAAHEK